MNNQSRQEGGVEQSGRDGSPLTLATEARLASIVQSSLDPIISKTLEGIICSWNPAAERVFGWPSTDVIGESIDLLIPEHRKREEEDLLGRVGQGELIESYETERVCREGNLVFVTLTSAPVRGSSGDIVGVTSIYRDLTTLKRTEAKFRSLLEVSPDAIIGVNEEGIIQLVTPQAEKLFGYPRQELLGSPIELLVPEAVRDAHPGHRASYGPHPVARPMGADIDLRGRKKDGSEFPVDVALSAIDTEEGIMISAAVRDITERIRITEERKQLENQLRQSRLESLGQLAGGIAHDFNNILAGTMSYARLVQDQLQETDPDSYQVAKDGLIDDVQHIVRATERAAALAHQLLLFGRKEVVQPEILDLNPVIGSMEDLLRRTIGEDIELIFTLRKPLSPIYMDRGHAEQILMNLVVNSRDAMRSGGRLVIETSGVTLDKDDTDSRDGISPGEYVSLVVSDSGDGMSSGVVDRAFEPFFTTKERGEGSGLGLATIYGIVKQAGGDISIYSEVGVGTTIKVYLPAVDGEAAGPSALEQVRLEARKGETILLVEDEAVVREPTVRILSKHGYEMLVADGPQEALRLSNSYSGNIDLMLTDVVMPEMSGKELAEHQRVFRPSTNVLFMSGYSHDIITYQGSVPDGVELIEKPFTTEALLRKVREVLDGGQSC